MIEVLNLKPGDVLPHSIAYIFGKCVDKTSKLVVIDSSKKSTEWDVKNCYFKAFVNLIPGKNEVILKTENSSLNITFFYKTPSETNKRFRVLYVVCEDDNGEFQSPPNLENSATSALKRISLATRLLQTFIAENIYKKFGIRKTITFKNELENVCELYKTKLTLEKALKMKQNELFLYIANEIIENKSMFDENCKYVAVLSFTRYVPGPPNSNDIFENTKGFCALGAEWLAVYGTACLYTWSESLQDLQRCFKDETQVDDKIYMNDSAFRNTYWACYSTSLGSLLHEMSHIVDLGHNNTGIMARGFDNLHLFFTVNLQACTCYIKFKNHSSNNKMIERVMTRDSESFDSLKIHKMKTETRLAMFKGAPERKFEPISVLIWNKSKLDSMSSDDTKMTKLKPACDCMLDCLYQDCNLSILCNHKWFNPDSISDQNEKNLFEIEINNENKHITVNALKGLLHYELRDKKANTLDYQTLKQINCEFFVIDRDKLHSSEKRLSSVELFLMDTNGNIQRTKIKI